MNGGAVITNEALKVKTGRDYPQCNPRLAMMDPTYTYSVPVRQLASGGFDILSHVMEIYFRQPDEENVSDDIAEALMRGVIRDLRASLRDSRDYTARSNLMWESTMGENRVIKLGKRMPAAESCTGLSMSTPASWKSCRKAEMEPQLWKNAFHCVCSWIQRLMRV